MVFLFFHTAIADPFSFIVTADMRNYSGADGYDISDYFRGVCEAIAGSGSGAFMISPGDIDPVEDVYWTIEQCLGSNYLWYPVVGNHELPGDGHESSYGANMDWLRTYDYDQNGAGAPPDIVNTGPTGCEETTFSFDYENAHFVIINEYYDGTSDTGTDGDVVDALYNWLVSDLSATDKQHIFIFGHEPAYPQPDEYNGRERHMTDCLNQHPDNRDRFWNLLGTADVAAYFCGHTHNYSSYYYNGVWQIDVGHSRGAGDTGAPSTFLRVTVNGNEKSDISIDVYRDIHDGIYDYNDINKDYSLPVELSSFSASAGDGEVTLKWITESELENDAFIIEKSINKEDFEFLVKIYGQGNTSSRTEYEFIDRNLINSKTYFYRLIDRSINGKLTYHDIIEVTPNGGITKNDFVLLNNYPNPFNSGTKIEYHIPNENKVLITIVNVLGQTIKVLKSENQNEGFHSVFWNGQDDFGHSLNSGLYFCVLKSGGFQKSMKMILVK